jgi:hypothetical protein
VAFLPTLLWLPLASFEDSAFVTDLFQHYSASTMSKILLLTTVLLLILAGSQTVNKDRVQPSDTSQFIVAILRGDKTLVPFAQYGNGGWTNPWPRPRQATEKVYSEDMEELVPHSLGNLPEPWFKQCGKIPNRWYFWSSVTTPVILKTANAVQVENHSQTNWALTTDFPTQRTDDTHHRNLGVALNVNQPVEPLLEIKSDSAEAAEVASFVRQVFDDADGAELKRLYRSGSRLNGEYLYYFEGEKKHERATISTERGCNDVSIYQGWITADERGGLGLLDSRKFLTNCDLKGPSFETPLGILKLRNTTYLFVTEHGWEDESYLILELDASGLHKVLETFGG